MKDYSSVWITKQENSGDTRVHVAPVSTELPLRLIKACSFVGETVLAPFVGCGTTLATFASEKRNGVGYELNEDIRQYVEKQFEAGLGK